MMVCEMKERLAALPQYMDYCHASVLLDDEDWYLITGIDDDIGGPFLHLTIDENLVVADRYSVYDEDSSSDDVLNDWRDNLTNIKPAYVGLIEPSLQRFADSVFLD